MVGFLEVVLEETGANLVLEVRKFSEIAQDLRMVAAAASVKCFRLKDSLLSVDWIKFSLELVESTFSSK